MTWTTLAVSLATVCLQSQPAQAGDLINSCRLLFAMRASVGQVAPVTPMEGHNVVSLFRVKPAETETNETRNADKDARDEAALDEKVNLDGRKTATLNALHAVRYVLQLADLAKTGRDANQLSDLDRARQKRANQVIVDTLNESYRNLVEWLPVYSHPDLDAVHDNTTKADLQKLKKQFVAIHALINDPRLASAVGALGLRVEPLSAYNEKLLTQFFPKDVSLDSRSIDIEFERPHFKKATSLEVTRDLKTLEGHWYEMREAIARTADGINTARERHRDMYDDEKYREESLARMDHLASTMEILVVEAELFAARYRGAIEANDSNLQSGQIDRTLALIRTFLGPGVDPRFGNLAALQVAEKEFQRRSIFSRLALHQPKSRFAKLEEQTKRIEAIRTQFNELKSQSATVLRIDQ